MVLMSPCESNFVIAPYLSSFPLCRIDERSLRCDALSHIGVPHGENVGADAELSRSCDATWPPFGLLLSSFHNLLLLITSSIVV